MFRSCHKAMEPEDDGNTDNSWCSGNSSKKLRKVIRVTQRKNQYHPDHNSVKISQNTEKSPEALGETSCCADTSESQ